APRASDSALDVAGRLLSGAPRGDEERQYRDNYASHACLVCDRNPPNWPAWDAGGKSLRQSRALAADAAIHELSARRDLAVSVHGHMVVGQQQQVGARGIRVELLSHGLGYQLISMDEQKENGSRVGLLDHPH